MATVTAGQVPTAQEERLGPPVTKGWISSSRLHLAARGRTPRSELGSAKADPLQHRFSLFLHCGRRYHSMFSNVVVQLHKWGKKRCCSTPHLLMHRTGHSCTQYNVSSWNQHISNTNKTHTNISMRVQPKKAEVFWDVQGIGFGKTVLYITQKDLEHWNL